MDLSNFTGVIGTTVGFMLAKGYDLLVNYVTGGRFACAVREELADAKAMIHEKMRWVLRDEKLADVKDTAGPNRLSSHSIKFTWHPETLPTRCVPRERLLYLGEPETFVVNLPFWEQHSLMIVELIPTKKFVQFKKEVRLIRDFETKFAELKMAFTTDLGNPERMATACFEDLMRIHDQLIPEKAPIYCLMQQDDDRLAARSGSEPA